MYKIILILTVLLALSCQGKRGINGIDGIDGLNLTTEIKVVYFSFDKNDLMISGMLASYRYFTDDLTEDIVSNGIVLVYQEYFGYWRALPFSMPIDIADKFSVDYVLDVSYLYAVGEVAILETSSLDPAISELCIAGDFKIVLLPPGDGLAKINYNRLIEEYRNLGQ